MSAHPSDRRTVSLITRPAQQADLPAVAALFDQYRQFYEQPADAAAALAFITGRFEQGESVLLVAQGDGGGELLGFCQLYPSFCSVEAAPIYTLYDLFVSPAARQGGVGRALLLAAEQRARADGMVRMDLTTARTNQQAQRLYEALGWVRDDVFLAYNRRVA
ncbi:MAG: GNAT family N-acetyltransferase [Burkholderiales bacterium PBB6]|nr:MAG: GNAT family N-acetyltransferase [Burkholderiales bacterium PBB6]